MARALADGDFSAWTNGAFLTHCGNYWLDWLDCLAELSSTRTTVAADVSVADD